VGTIAQGRQDTSAPEGAPETTQDRVQSGVHGGVQDGLRFRVLGPLSVDVDGRALDIGPLKQRLVLALLLCRPNAFVSSDLLTETVWRDEPPKTARKNLQVYISALRKLLGEAGEGERLSHRLGSYRLRVAEGELDALRFQGLARSGRAAAATGSFGTAAELLAEALDLWTGPPLPELGCSPVIQEEADRLAARHVGVCEDWAEAALALGQSSPVAEALADLVERHPLRERLRAAQMTALYRSGRQTEALAVYEELRQHLSRELGLPPSPALDGLYQSILAQEAPGGGAHRPPSGAGTVLRASGGRSDHGDRTDTAPGSHPRPGLALLPPDTADFTGRKGQTAELLDALAHGGTVAIVTGPTGVGKTALASRVAHRLTDQYPDGQVYVRLRHEDGSPRSRGSVMAELGRWSGLADRIPDDPITATALWRSWLADRRVLLVLDGAPDEVHVRPLLPCDGPSSAVVTSRTQLAGLTPAHRLDVPPHSSAEALELLGRIIGLGRVRSDETAAERIVTACGMLPLAVRAAGLKLAVLRHLPLAEYATRLSDDLRVLDELSAGDTEVRSHVTDEWRRLPETARAALLRLGTLPPLFTLDEAVTALAQDRAAALRSLERLIESGAVLPPASEVTAHSALYALPRLTRLYVRELALGVTLAAPSA
jgi:DNA-binding SARP family transcriptional activator